MTRKITIEELKSVVRKMEEAHLTEADIYGIADNGGYVEEICIDAGSAENFIELLTVYF